jgi:hypothetical protein
MLGVRNKNDHFKRVTTQPIKTDPRVPLIHRISSHPLYLHRQAFKIPWFGAPIATKYVPSKTLLAIIANPTVIRAVHATKLA